MKAWKIEYTNPKRFGNDMAVVLAPTIRSAIVKISKKLKLGPRRIQSVARIESNFVIVKA
jgi:hypothetical protein